MKPEGYGASNLHFSQDCGIHREHTEFALNTALLLLIVCENGQARSMKGYAGSGDVGVSSFAAYLVLYVIKLNLYRVQIIFFILPLP